MATPRIPKAQATLLKRVMRFCKATDTRPETFGRNALNDAGLVKDMRKGRELRYWTRRKVEGYMQQELQKAQGRLSRTLRAIVTPSRE